MTINGGREPMAFEYKVGFDDSGKISGLELDMYMDSGCTRDMSGGSLDMGMLWADNAYYFENYCATAYLCKTNLPTNTSMRAPGVVQSSLATELIVERVAFELGLPVTQVQELNFYQDGDKTPYRKTIEDSTLPTVWGMLKENANYDQRLQEAEAFNETYLWKKRGVSITPVKYGIAWSGYDGGVVVNINNSDGTVLVRHSGCEIGQGLSTKLAQVVAYELGVDMSTVKVNPTRTDVISNGGMTGGSATSEVICQAAINACKTLNDRMNPQRLINPDATWLELLSAVNGRGVSLNSEGWFSPTMKQQGGTFAYYVWAAALTEVELDVLTGEITVTASHIVYDCGISLNPAIDIGQIEGAFIMGLGYFTTENVVHDQETGQLLTEGTWEYKPPMALDIPLDFSVTLLDNSPNNNGILRSKATGEPPYIIANSIYFALRMAISASRDDASSLSSKRNEEEEDDLVDMVNYYFDMQASATIDVRHNKCLVSPRRLEFTLGP